MREILDGSEKIAPVLIEKFVSESVNVRLYISTFILNFDKKSAPIIGFGHQLL